MKHRKLAASNKLEENDKRVTEKNERDQTENDEVEDNTSDWLSNLLLGTILATFGGLVLYISYQFVTYSTMDMRMTYGLKVDPIHVRLNVDLPQLYTGHDTEINLNRHILCPQCGGLGFDTATGFQTCHDCNGAGVRTFIQQIGPIKQRVRGTCNTCKGHGKVPKKICEQCHGHGTLHDYHSEKVTIDPGMHHGDTIRLEHQGNQALRKRPGDVIIHLNMKPHPIYTRRGNDLEMVLEISLLEALVGFTREIPHVMEDKRVNLQREEIVEPTTVWIIPHQGMPIPHTKRYGDLIIRFSIKYPTELSQVERSRIRELLPM